MATDSLISAISAAQNLEQVARTLLVNTTTTRANALVTAGLAKPRGQQSGAALKLPPPGGGAALKLPPPGGGAALKLPSPGGGSAIVAQNFAQNGDDKKAEKKSEDDADDVRRGELSDEEKAAVARLKKIDREVRAHERAHKTAGGRFTGATQLQFQRGPDGRRYAVAGEVSIDVSKVAGNPDATIRKLETVRRAALAPAKPSAQDRRVAAIATQGIAAARGEKRAERREAAEEAAGERDVNPLDNDNPGLPPAIISADIISQLAEVGQGNIQQT